MHHSNPKKQNIIGLAVMAVFSVLVILISTPAYSAIHRMTRADLPEPAHGTDRRNLYLCRYRSGRERL